MGCLQHEAHQLKHIDAPCAARGQTSTCPHSPCSLIRPTALPTLARRARVLGPLTRQPHHSMSATPASSPILASAALAALPLTGMDTGPSGRSCSWNFARNMFLQRGRNDRVGLGYRAGTCHARQQGRRQHRLRSASQGGRPERDGAVIMQTEWRGAAALSTMELQSLQTEWPPYRIRLARTQARGPPVQAEAGARTCARRAAQHPVAAGRPAGAPKHDLAADLQLGALERLDLAVVDKRPVCGVEVGDRHLVAALCAVPRALSTRSLQNAVAQASTRGGREAPWLLRTHGLPADTQPPLPGPPRSPRPDAARLKQRRGAHRPAAWRAGWTQWGPAR